MKGDLYNVAFTVNITASIVIDVENVEDVESIEEAIQKARKDVNLYEVWASLRAAEREAISYSIDEKETKAWMESRTCHRCGWNDKPEDITPEGCSSCTDLTAEEVEREHARNANKFIEVKGN